MVDKDKIVLTQEESDELKEFKEKLEREGILVQHLDGNNKPIIFEDFASNFYFTYKFISSERTARIKIYLDHLDILQFSVVKIL